MKLMLSTLLITAWATISWAGHSRGNGTCMDDAIHWQNMIEKRTDAPLYENSKVTQSQAMEKKVTGDTEACEALMEEALRMIRKTNGEYATE